MTARTWFIADDLIAEAHVDAALARQTADDAQREQFALAADLLHVTGMPRLLKPFILNPDRDLFALAYRTREVH